MSTTVFHHLEAFAPAATHPTGADALLRALGAALAAGDGALLSYALVGERLYLGVEACPAAIPRLMARLSPRLGRDCYLQLSGAAAAFAARMIACQHNAPVRDARARTAWDAAATSHRAYVGLAPAPAWLAVRRGLALCGLDDSDRGRRRFDEQVLERVGDTLPAAHDTTLAERFLTPPTPRTSRFVALRADDTFRAPKAAPALAELTATRPFEGNARAGSAAIARWRHELDALVGFACALAQVDERELRGGVRRPALERLREAIVWAWTRRLGRPALLACAAFGRPPDAFARTIGRLDRGDELPARRLADVLARACESLRDLPAGAGASLDELTAARAHVAVTGRSGEHATTTLPARRGLRGVARAHR